MDKRRNVIMIAAILAGILVLVLIGVAIYKYVAPSNTKKELSSVYELKEN